MSHGDDATMARIRSSSEVMSASSRQVPTSNQTPATGGSRARSLICTRYAGDDWYRRRGCRPVVPGPGHHGRTPPRRGGGAPLELTTNAGPMPEPTLPDRFHVGQVQSSTVYERPQPRSELADPSGILEPSRVIQPGRPTDPSAGIDLGPDDPGVPVESVRTADPGAFDRGRPTGSVELSGIPAAGSWLQPT